MRNRLLFAAVVIGALVLFKRFGPKMQGIDWEKHFENMPDDAPPKWMFRNISAIRENTDRIREIAERDGVLSAAVEGR